MLWRRVRRSPRVRDEETVILAPKGTRLHCLAAWIIISTFRCGRPRSEAGGEPLGWSQHPCIDQVPSFPLSEPVAWTSRLTEETSLRRITSDCLKLMKEPS